MSAGAVREEFSIEDRVYYDSLINLVKKYALEFCRHLGSGEEMQQDVEKLIKVFDPEMT